MSKKWKNNLSWVKLLACLLALTRSRLNYRQTWVAFWFIVIKLLKLLDNCRAKEPLAWFWPLSIQNGKVWMNNCYSIRTFFYRSWNFMVRILPRIQYNDRNLQMVFWESFRLLHQFCQSTLWPVRSDVEIFDPTNLLGIPFVRIPLGCSDV